MADQQSFGEDPVGAPGGGARAKNSAAFTVNDKSLRDLRMVWQGLTSDVRAFNAELAKVAKNSAGLGQMGLPRVAGTRNVAGGSSARGSLSTSLSTGSISGSVGVQGVSGGSIAPLPSQRPGGGVTTPSGPSRSSTVAVGIGAGVIGAAGSYTSSHMSNISDLDYIANRGAIGENGAYSSANKSAIRLSLSNMSGFRDSKDLIAGVTTMQAQGYSYGTARASAISSGVQAFAAVNPAGGLSTGATAYAGLYSSQANASLRAMGVGASIGAQGVRQDPTTVARGVLTRIFRGRMPTAQELQEGMQQGAPLYQSLQQFPPETQQAIVQYGLQQANGGGGQGDSIVASKNLFGRAQTRMEQAFGGKASGMIQSGLGFFAGASDVGGTVAATPGVGNAIALGGTGSMMAGTVGKSALSSGGGFLGWKVAQGGLNKAAGALDNVRGLGTLTRAAGSRAGMQAAEAEGATPVYVMNWPTGFGGGSGAFTGMKGGKSALNTTETVAKDAEDVAGGAGEGAAAGGFLGKLKGLLGKNVGKSAVSTGAGDAGAAGGAGEAGAALLSGTFVAGAGLALGAGITAIKYGVAHSNASLGAQAVDSQSSDQLEKVMERTQLWNLMTIPAFAKEYHARIEPMIRAAMAIPMDGMFSSAAANARSRAAAALSALQMKYRVQGSANMKSSVNALASSMTAAAANQAGADPFNHGTGGLSTPGGAGAAPAATKTAAGGGAPLGGNEPAVVKVAEQFLGLPYIYGGTTPKGFDCLAEGTMVTTARGEVPIEEITTADSVLTRRGYRRVLRAWMVRADAPTVALLVDGRTVRGTADHRVWTENRGWVPLFSITPFDTLVSCQPSQYESSSTASRTTATQTLPGPRFAPTSSVLEDLCTELSGSSSTDLYLPDMKSTTLTTTRSTTTSRTSRAPRRPSTGRKVRRTADCTITSARCAGLTSRHTPRRVAHAGSAVVSTSRSSTTIVDGPRSSVYDLMVEGEHEFFADGVLVHNCSGLTGYAYSKLGITLPRTAAAQQRAYPEVPANQAKPGDLVTFGNPAHHVALYAGDGQMIESPHTGDRIKFANVYQDQTQYHRVVGGTIGGALAGVGAAGSLGGGVPGAAEGVANAAVSAVGGAVSSIGNGISSFFGGSSTSSSAGGGAFVESNPSVDETGAYFAGGGGGGFSGFASASAAAGMTATNIPALAIKATGKVSSGGAAGAAPSSVAGNTALAKQMAAAQGWGSSAEWNALYAVWQQESGFKTTAGSPAHAYGIPQALPGNKMAQFGSDWMTNPATQIKWGLNYIAGRYHDPIGAEAHKRATDSNLGATAPLSQPGGWYEKGAWGIVRDQIAQLHQGEMVLPARVAANVRNAVKQDAVYASAGGAGPNGFGSSGGRNGGQVIVQLTAPISLIGTATAKDADDFVTKVENRIKTSETIRMMGEH